MAEGRVYLPQQITDMSQCIVLGGQREVDGVYVHDVFLKTHDDAGPESDDAKIVVQTPLVACHGVFHAQDGRRHLLIDATSAKLYEMLQAVDDAIVTGVAAAKEVPKDAARLRYLSSLKDSARVKKLKVRVPFSDDVPNVTLFDAKQSPLDSATLVRDNLRGAKVACIIELDAAWSIGERASWFGSNWKLRSMLIRRTPGSEGCAFLPVDSPPRSDAARNEER